MSLPLQSSVSISACSESGRRTSHQSLLVEIHSKSMDYLPRSGWTWHGLQSLIRTATTPRICRRTALCFKHVRINVKCPAAVTSRNIPPHRPAAIRQGLPLRQGKASSSTCALHLIESTRARIVQGEQDYSEKPHGEHSTSRARRFCALMDSNVGDSIREPHVALHGCDYRFAPDSCRPVFRASDF